MVGRCPQDLPKQKLAKNRNFFRVRNPICRLFSQNVPVFLNSKNVVLRMGQKTQNFLGASRRVNKFNINYF
uniref:Uncharacterized protein n=1 Tax=Romanomermis culicivorax TaxID=13658 RepID=A0A915JQ97_ROMCU